jgi:hypothetical protein
MMGPVKARLGGKSGVVIIMSFLSCQLAQMVVEAHGDGLESNCHVTKNQLVLNFCVYLEF